MNAKIIASLAFTSMFSLSTLLSPAHAERKKALNFGIISTESQQNLKPQWTPFLQDMEKKLGVKVNASLPRTTRALSRMRFNKVDIAGTAICRRWNGGSRQWRLRPDGRGGWIAGLLERVDRQQRQSDQQPERSAGEAERSHLWQWRS